MEIQESNHFISATDAFINGKSHFNELLNKYAHLSEEDTIQMKNFVSLLYSSQFIQGLKNIPCPYHNYYFFTKEQLDEELEQFKMGTVRGEVVSKNEKELFEIYQDENLAVKTKQLEERGGDKYSDATYTGDRDLAITALNINPLCDSDKTANIVVDELLKAYKQYLPQFFK